MYLHHSWGGPLAVVLFSRQSSKKSVNLGTLPGLDYCHQTPYEKHGNRLTRRPCKGDEFEILIFEA